MTGGSPADFGKKVDEHADAITARRAVTTAGAQRDNLGPSFGGGRSPRRDGRIDLR
jgi:hypothetical protein